MSDDKQLALFGEDQPLAMPDYIQEANQSIEDTSAKFGESYDSIRMSNARVFSIYKDGEKIDELDNDTGEILILDSSRDIGRMAYANMVYNPDETNPVRCWSDDGKVPASEVPAPVGESCSTCPWNVKGSGANGKSRRCGFTQVLAVHHRGTNGVYRMQLKSQSIFGDNDVSKGLMSVEGLSKFCAKRKLNWSLLRLRAVFDRRSETAKVMFGPVSQDASEWFISQAAAASIPKLREKFDTAEMCRVYSGPGFVPEGVEAEESKSATDATDIEERPREEPEAKTEAPQKSEETKPAEKPAAKKAKPKRAAKKVDEPKVEDSTPQPETPTVEEDVVIEIEDDDELLSLLNS